jgi:hypothetical protein
MLSINKIHIINVMDRLKKINSNFIGIDISEEYTNIDNRYIKNINN